MEEYHSGEADTISGITAVSDKVVEIEFKEMHPGMQQQVERSGTLHSETCL